MGPLRVLGNMGAKAFISRSKKMRGIGAQRKFWGTGSKGNEDFDFGQQGNKAIEPEHDTANKMNHAHGEDADQPGNPPRLTRVFAVRSIKSHESKVSSCGQLRLIRLGGCPG